MAIPVPQGYRARMLQLTAAHQSVVEERPEARKAAGVYYTPGSIVEPMVERTLGRWLAGKAPRRITPLRIVDPACGRGGFLVAAFQCLLDWHLGWYLQDGPRKHGVEICETAPGRWRLTGEEGRRILRAHIFGVDLDPQAVEITRLALCLQLMGEPSPAAMKRQPSPSGEPLLSDLADNIKCGNALVGPDFPSAQASTKTRTPCRISPFDWDAAFPGLAAEGGFQVVIGNPPWGQKAVTDDAVLKHYLRDRYPSSRGIHDLFRPFVEQSVRLLCPGGTLALVLPDIVLLKNYEATRRLLLEHLTLEAIDWWGMAFPSATIDAVTVIGTRKPAPPDHRIQVAVHDMQAPLRHEVAQTDFWANPRCTFNLYLTPAKRKILRRLERCPRLGDCFEVHEGVHSGNIRTELFVHTRLDASCRELYFGRGEISPYRLHWQGAYLRLGAVPTPRTGARYANLGQTRWYERLKLLVRRTGDRVLAAVDRHRRFVSNNFFVVFPRQPSALSLDGLCALLNSRFMTWYFRTIEPRCGRAFAELKIKHLAMFPLPPAIQEAGLCRRINRLGALRARLARRVLHPTEAANLSAPPTQVHDLDGRINALVFRLYDVPDSLVEAPLA
jgi:hypothetical protein